MIYWYYFVMEGVAHDLHPDQTEIDKGANLRWLTEENLSNIEFVDQIYFLHKIQPLEEGVPVLDDPFTITMDGEIIFKLENETVIAEIIKQTLCQM